MKKREKGIFKAFNGKLIGKPYMKKMVCEVVAKLSDELAGYITQNCWFLASMEDAWGFTFTGRDIKDHHLIFLSDELFSQEESQIRYSIAHEIGHVILKHRNSLIVEQAREEVKQQEREADLFAKEVLSIS